MLPHFISQLGPDQAAVSLPVWLELTAVAVGAISGVLEAQRRKLDLMGYLGLAMVCALGGGLIRDVIMQAGSVYMIDSPYAITVSLVVAVVGFLFTTALLKVPNLIEWADILAVGLFAATGSDKAIYFGLNPLVCILMGILTGVGGGMLRDIMLGDVPRIFKRGNLYATCALGGSVTYYVAVLEVYVYRPWAVALCVLTTVLLRRISLRYDVSLPDDGDITPRVARHMRELYHSAQHEGELSGDKAIYKHDHRK